jgi:hypothetical protein
MIITKAKSDDGRSMLASSRVAAVDQHLSRCPYQKLGFGQVAILILVKADQNYDWNLEKMAAMTTPQHLCFSAVREIVVRRED